MSFLSDYPNSCFDCKINYCLVAYCLQKFLDILFENWLRLRLQRFSPRTSKSFCASSAYCKVWVCFCSDSAEIASIAISKPKQKKHTQTCEVHYLINNNL